MSKNISSTQLHNIIQYSPFRCVLGVHFSNRILFKKKAGSTLRYDLDQPFVLAGDIKTKTKYTIQLPTLRTNDKDIVHFDTAPGADWYAYL